MRSRVVAALRALARWENWVGPMTLALHFRVCRGPVPSPSRYSNHCSVTVRRLPWSGAVMLFSINKRYEWRFLLWHRQTVASTHQVCAKLLSHRSEGWEHIVMPTSSTSLANCSLFSLLRAYLAAISHWVSLFSHNEKHHNCWFGRQRRNIILCSAIACTAAASFASVSEVAANRCYACSIIIAPL